jgi:aminoglycoside 6'-N-acetyltransferase
VIRRYSESDLRPLLEIVNQPEVSRWWGSWTRAELKKEISNATLAFTIEIDERPGGYIAVNEESDPDSYGFDIDIFLDFDHVDQGLGTEALRHVMRMMFEGRGHHRAEIYVNPGNSRARRAYEKVGFKDVGIVRKCARMDDGKWHDELLMDLLAEEMT